MKDEILDIHDYKYIANLVEEKLPILRQNKDFNNKYMKLIDLIEIFEKNLDSESKTQFNEIIDLFYKTEEYYFILSYSLGVKYNHNLKKL